MNCTKHSSRTVVLHYTVNLCKYRRRHTIRAKLISLKRNQNGVYTLSGLYSASYSRGLSRFLYNVFYWWYEFNSLISNDRFACWTQFVFWTPLTQISLRSVRSEWFLLGFKSNANFQNSWVWKPRTAAGTLHHENLIGSWISQLYLLDCCCYSSMLSCWIMPTMLHISHPNQTNISTLTLNSTLIDFLSIKKCCLTQILYHESWRWSRGR